MEIMREKARNFIRKKLSGKIDIYIFFFFEVEKKMRITKVSEKKK